MARKAPTPYDQDIGFIISRLNPISRGWTILYDGDGAGLDTSEGRWQILCSEHGVLHSEKIKTSATKLLTRPSEWCRGCARKKAEIENTTSPMQEIAYDHRQGDDSNREIRFWATKAKNNPEKCSLFEQMYGFPPDQFWD